MRDLRRCCSAILVSVALIGGCTDDDPGSSPQQLGPVGDGGLAADAAIADAWWLDATTTDAGDASLADGSDAAITDAAITDAGCNPDGGDAGDAGCASDAGTDAMTDAMTDARADAGVDAGMGCPVNPTCSDTSPTRITSTNPTGLCRGMCDPLCQADYWRWSFWVTQYNVPQTHGWGEHQGIAIIGHSYKYDARFAWNAPGAAAPPWRNAGALWTQGMPVSTARQFEMRTTNPSGESIANVPMSLSAQPATRFAYCSHTPLIDTKIYDHGRSLARTIPTDAYYASRNLIPMRPLAVQDQCRSAAGTWCRSATLQHPTQIGTCMATITDGACDTKCGNCSYVAINQAAQTGNVAYWEDVNLAPPRAPGIGVRGARNEPAARVEYAGGATPGALTGTVDNPWVRFYSWNLIRGWFLSAVRRVEAPYTHCYDTTAGFVIGTNNPQEWVLDSTPDTVTGRWGHNSNTDAEMAFTMFNGCGTTPTTTNTAAGVHAACGVCGTPVGPAATTTQYPCRARTCTATIWWGRTGGIHNIVDLSPGIWPGFPGNPNTAAAGAWRTTTRPMPTCRWGAFTVWGM